MSLEPIYNARNPDIDWDEITDCLREESGQFLEYLLSKHRNTKCSVGYFLLDAYKHIFPSRPFLKSEKEGF